MDLEKTYNVLGQQMDYFQIMEGGPPLLRQWRLLEPKSRDLCDYEYGHNYNTSFSKEWSEETGFSFDDLRKVSRLATYKFLEIPLTDEETALLGYYNGRVDEIRQAKRQATEARKKKIRKDFEG